MAEHLTHHADEAGRLVDIPAVLDAYAARHALSYRVGWTDLTDRLVEMGLVRQVCAAAPERQARYVLCMDLALLPDDLPADLARELRRYIDDPVAAAKGRPTRAGIDAALADCEVVREGSATRSEAIATSSGCGRLHTSPYTREGSPPSHQQRPSQAPRRPRRLPFRGQDFDEKRAEALNFVKTLAPQWASQRGGQVLEDAELAALAPMVALLLRHMPRSEAAELLTAQVASADDLAGVLRWRIGRTLAGVRRAVRRAAAIVVDDDGSAHAAWLAANAERNAAAAERKAAVVALARRLAARTRGDGLSRPTSPESPRRGVRAGQAAGAAVAAPGGPWRAAAEPREVFEREVLHRHALPAAEPCRLTEPEPAPLPEPDAAALAAERAWLVQMMTARTQNP
ncbi:hypothetical protein [Streptosporangium sandarakinum]|uniref:hypothetical protein n=1 Tax=Streptosporangium sandarakinum TaxID=1260955 RepID=UPI0033A40EAF